MPLMDGPPSLSARPRGFGNSCVNRFPNRARRSHNIGDGNRSIWRVLPVLRSFGSKTLLRVKVLASNPAAGTLAVVYNVPPGIDINPPSSFHSTGQRILVTIDGNHARTILEHCLAASHLGGDGMGCCPEERRRRSSATR